jgi:predicted membrane channel-forming protein YqfA (hemolysin III family)
MFLRWYRQNLSIKYCLTVRSCLYVRARGCMSLRVFTCLHVRARLRVCARELVTTGVGVCLFVEGGVKHALCYGHVSKSLPESHEIWHT